MSSRLSSRILTAISTFVSSRLTSTGLISRAAAAAGAIALFAPWSVGVTQSPPKTALTPAQKLVAELKPVGDGFILPPPPVPPDGPWPSADPRDLRGTWFHNQRLEQRMRLDMYGELLPYTMKSAQIVVRRVKANEAGTPYVNASAICRPPGQAWQLDLHFPFTIFQTANTMEMVFQEFHGRWQIAFDRALLPDSKPYMGRSVGRWNGDTFVVETSNFKKAFWLDTHGNPVSTEGKLTQRFRKIDLGDHQYILEVVTQVLDPNYYTKPWSYVRTYSWQPNLALFREYNCEEQIGDPGSDPHGGLLREPEE